MGIPGSNCGRVHHRPRGELAAIDEGLRARGLVNGSGRFTAAGRTQRTTSKLLPTSWLSRPTTPSPMPKCKSWSPTSSRSLPA